MEFPPAKFTQDFVTAHAGEWQRLLAHLAGRPNRRFLEIGSLEGRSALWWLDNVLTDPSSTLTCVDPWLDAAHEQRFDNNIAESRRGGQIRKIKATSRAALGLLPLDYFDFAYVDGSHNACDALADGLAVLPLLKAGGILLFDDYEWDDPKWYDDLPPRPGIDAFLSVCAARVKILNRGYQIAVAKNASPMTESAALAKMFAPSHRRPGIWRGGVLQIWTTRACDKSCFGCTQGSNLSGKPGFITPDQFEVACQSLRGYWGVVGVFGGNPCTHPAFPTLCEILSQYFPFEQRGLWSNNLLGHGAIARRTFNPDVSNLNVHLDQAAFDEFRATWPESKPFGLDSDSRHAPPYVALQDVIPDEGQRWELIANCDINRRWSAMICTVRGLLRGFFCELAGAQAMLHQAEPDYPDLGVAIEPGWWQKSMQEFAPQVRYHCHACGIPLRGHGALAQDETGTEQVSQTHAERFQPKRPGRLVQLVTDRAQLGVPLEVATDYVANAQK